MTNTIDSDTYLAQRPRSFAELSGEQVDAGYDPADQPRAPARHSSAALIDRAVTSRRRRAVRDRALRQVDAIAQQATEDAALDQAIAMTRAGRRDKIPAATLALAQSAMARREGSRPESAEVPCRPLPGVRRVRRLSPKPRPSPPAEDMARPGPGAEGHHGPAPVSIPRSTP
jgi:hypothetical protein